MKCEIVTVTPSMAESWLELSNNFRQPSPGQIARYAADMEAGKWDENGETIKFNVKDELVDGQHRLLACAKSGKPFRTVVVYGVKSDLNVDSGAKRALSDWLKHHGHEKNSKQIAATLATLYCMRLTGHLEMNREARAKRTYTELLKLLKKEPTIVDSVYEANGAWKLLEGSVINTLLHLFKEKDPVMAKDFIEVLCGRKMINNTDPVAQLREKLLQDKGSKTKMTKRYKAGLVILAWNYWRRGQGCRVLKWTEAGPTAHSFPEIE